jgi:hypothetical protein
MIQKRKLKFTLTGTLSLFLRMSNTRNDHYFINTTMSIGETRIKKMGNCVVEHKYAP